MKAVGVQFIERCGSEVVRATRPPSVVGVDVNSIGVYIDDGAISRIPSSH